MHRLVAIQVFHFKVLICRLYMLREMLFFPVLQCKVSLYVERMFYADHLTMLQILLKLTFCAIHLRQDLAVLILLLLTLQLLRSKICHITVTTTRKILLSGPSISTSGGGSLDSGCFCFSSCSIASVRDKIPFDILFVSNFKTPFTLPLFIKILHFIEILVTACYYRATSTFPV